MSRTNVIQFGLLSAIAFAVLCSQPAFGQERGEKPRFVLTPEREAAAKLFARRHHPELADLLDKLQEEMQKQYTQAIRQIYQASERLARIKERSEEDYKLQLNLWKVDSRINLLAARMTKSKDKQLRRQLEQLLRERVAVKRNILKRDREKVQTRLDRIDKSLEALSDVDAAVAADMKRYERIRPASRSKSKNANARDKTARTKNSKSNETRTKN